MTRRHLMTLRLLLMGADAAITAAVFWIVSVVRFEADPSVRWSVGIDVAPAAAIFALMWVGVFYALGQYRLRVRWSLLAEARDVIRGTAVVLVLTLSLLFLVNQPDVSRVFLAMLFVVQPIVILAVRTLVRRRFESQRLRGRDTGFMLVVGVGRMAQSFADRVEAHPSLGMRVAGHLSTGREVGDEAPTRPVLGTVDQMYAVFHDRVIDEVAVCLDPNAADFLDPIVAVAAEEGKTVRVPRDLEEGILTTALTEEFDGFLVHSIIHDGQRDFERAVKRITDVIGAVVGLVILSPFVVAVAVAIVTATGRPVLFRQTRIGRHGRPFTMLKFRTMAVGAEERLAELADKNEVSGPAFKIREDPRITRVGRFLRRSSLDELPQLWNVLIGSMSLVGPRPALPNEVAVYDIWHRRRLSVRPGMTGLWQIEARTNDQFDERAELDLRYIDQWSLWRDFGILARTLPALFGRPGH